LTTRPPEIDISCVQDKVRIISDEAFEILNTLQFQDITRQKVEKVITLLKQFQQGLQRLLRIFKIEQESEAANVFDHRPTATGERIFETTLEKDSKKESVEDIIAEFKKSQT
jgi:chemotaxis regulatin CheY-phosphate phosphatase CheZ